MSYPHVRVAATGRVEFFQTAEEFANSASWTEREATGWVRTEGIAPKIAQAAPDKLHLAGGWTRYNGAGQPILSNRVVYILTRLKGRWGIQARFACGASTTWKSAVDEDPGNLAERFLLRLRGGDIEKCARMVRYPFIVVKTGAVRRFESDISFVAYLRELNLTPMELCEIGSIQIGQQGANVGVSFTTYDSRTVHALFLIARKDDDYRLAAISLISF